MNVHCFNGRLCADAELKNSSAGKPYCTFNVAVQHWQKDATGKRKVSFFSCIAFGATAEIASKVQKGDLVSVSGEPAIEEYEDKDGGRRKSYKLTVKDFDLLEFKPKKETKSNPVNDEPQFDSEIVDPFQ